MAAYLQLRCQPPIANSLQFADSVCVLTMKGGEGGIRASCSISEAYACALI